MTEQQLNIISDMAAHFMTPHEIAIVLGVDHEEFMLSIADRTTIEYLHYHKSKIESILEIRRKVVKMAKSGSPQAEMLVTGFIKDQQIKEDI